jgi:hypothetical protein
MAEIKHAGRVKATGKKCLVAYRTLPGDAFNCLIIPTENLPDSYHDALINLVESSSGQDAFEFAEVLARSRFPDGSTMLPALHTQNRLVKVSTDQIEMTPTTSVVVLLSELNQIIAEQRGLTVHDLAIKSGVPENANTTIVDEIASATPVQVLTTEESVLTVEDRVAKYRADAAKLFAEATALTAMADSLSPVKVEAVVEKPVTAKVTAKAVVKTPVKTAAKPAVHAAKTVSNTVSTVSNINTFSA